MQDMPRLELQRVFFKCEISFFLVKILGLYLYFETYPKQPPDGSEQDWSSGEIYFLNKG